MRKPSPDTVGMYFVDTDTGLPLLDERWDSEGVPLIGEDELGFWWGTERAAWVLSPQSYTVWVNGYLGPENWTGVFIGTEEEAYDYAYCRGVKDIELQVDVELLKPDFL